jgi:3-oxoacyl-[acyl-carrier protein] reductase
MNIPVSNEQAIAATQAATEKQNCIVTGGAGAIGSAICAALARAGHHVIVVDIDGDRAGAVAANLVQEGHSASSASCDVASTPDIDLLRDKVLAEFGHLAILVNLAGAVRNAAITKVTDEDFEATFIPHVRGTLAMMRAFIPDMKRRRYGRIVNTSSIAARGSVGGSSYGASKAAIEGLTRAAALEVAHHNITVNCIAPGLIGAGMFLTTPEDFRNKWAERIPMKRIGTPEDVAPCVAFLASEPARYITGQTLTVCGGLSIGF